MKICKTCGEEKPLLSFRKGYNSCNSCRKERAIKSYMEEISKPLERCKFCGTVINEGVLKNLKNKGYCSKWCKEEANPPKIVHVCLDCGTATDPILQKHPKGKFYEQTGEFLKPCGMYYKLCFKCYLKKYGKIYKTFNMLDDDKITLEEIEEKWKQKNVKYVVKNVQFRLGLIALMNVLIK